jgi:hypothetical protein
MDSDARSRRMLDAVREQPQSQGVAITVAATAAGVLAVFLINLLSGALPLKLLDPQWQLKVILLVIANVSFPLMGFMLLCLAPEIDPAVVSLRRWRRRSQSLAVGVVLLLLLIIPLQSFATWRLIRQAETAQVAQLRRDQRQFRALEEAIQGATTTADLQRRLQVLEGPVLGREDQGRPLAEVRRRLLQALELARVNNRNQLARVPLEEVGALVANTIQISATALVLALCFAAGARRPGSRTSLLEELLQLGRSFRGLLHRPWKDQGMGSRY